MRIVIDARFYGLENAGLGRYTIHLIDQLYQVDKKNEYYVLLRKKYFDLLTMPPNWHKIRADFKHYGFAEQLKLSRIIINLKPDITHFLHFNVPILFREPYIVTIHDLLMHRQKGKDATTLSYPWYLFKRMGYSSVFRSAVRKAMHIIVPTQFVQNDLANYYRLPKEKISVIYEGVEPKVVVKNVRTAILKKYNLPEKYFIYTGNAYPHKNLPRAVEAILSLNKLHDKKIALAIVSSRNVFVKRLEQLIRKLEAQKYVKLLGFVPDNDLVQLYRNSIGFLYPSTMEGFGLPGLEAMNAGTLVLVSDIPVFKEVYKNSVVYFNPYNFSSITEAMKEALELKADVRKKVIAHGQQFVKRYSWRKMAEETRNLYEEYNPKK